MARRAYLTTPTGLRPFGGGPDVPFTGSDPATNRQIVDQQVVKGRSIFDNPTWTGPIPGVALDVRTGDLTITTGGTATAPFIVENFQRHGTITVKAPYVTIRNGIAGGPQTTTPGGNTACIVVDPTVAGTVEIDDVLCQPDYPSVWVNGINGWGFTAKRVKTRNTVDGLGIFNPHQAAGSDYQTGVVLDCVDVNGLAYFTPDPNHTGGTNPNETHNDGVQLQGGKGTRITRSSIVGKYGTAGTATFAPNQTSPQGYVAPLSCLMLGQNTGLIGGLYIADNYLPGGYIAVNCGGAGTGTNLGSIIRNEFPGDCGLPGHEIEPLQSQVAAGTVFGVGTSDRNYYSSGAEVPLRIDAG